MYRKIVWCYVFILTLLDVSLNTKLSAQGKSHGVTVHDSLIEGITFQEWGKESVGSGSAAAGGGRAVSAGALSLSPASLEFGRAALAAAHALTVTLTNTANTTMHLASVAGTTPDFHASFFESKTLPPQANTTFSVVYLGRREGPVSAHLYIHTSLGVHKYPVSAVGVASEWGVWPLVGVRVPLNATVEPLLTMHNPTDHTIQVSEVYSSGAWLGLQLPDGGESAPRHVWSLPPRASRPLVRLRITPPPHHAAHHTLTAYIRIKANITGGGLVVCVEARPAPAGEYASPLQLRLSTRGSGDPVDVLDISAGNSASSGVELDASVWAARCSATPTAPHPPPSHATHATPNMHNGETKGTANGNGVKSEGVSVSLVRSHLEPYQQLTHAAQLTFDYAKMWSGYTQSSNGAGGAGGEAGAGAEGAWCGGWVLLGKAALPYSVRLLPGAVRLVPDAVHLVSAHEEALSAREVFVHNEFPTPVHVASIDYPDDVDKYFEVESLAPLVVAPGASSLAVRVRRRATQWGAEGDGQGGKEASVRSHVTLRTNVTDYTLPVLAYSGRLDIEWEWPNSADGTLRLGAVGASSTRRVGAKLWNRGVVALCVAELRVALPGAQLALDNCAARAHTPPQHECRCVGGGEYLSAWLTVVAPARAGPLAGHVWWRAAARGLAEGADGGAGGGGGGHASAAVQLTAHHGRVHVADITLANAAPYAWSSAPLVLESTMALTMKVQHVTLPEDNPALIYEPSPEGGTVAAVEGRQTVGTVLYAPERLCEPDCYTGLNVDTPEGAAWVRRSMSPAAESLRADALLQRARHALYSRRAALHNVTLHLHTDHVVQIPVVGSVVGWWPRLAASPGDAGLAGVGGAVPLRMRARNPSRSHSLLLQPVIAGPLPELAGAAESPLCRTESCLWSRDAFKLSEWRATRGDVTAWLGGDVTARPGGDVTAPRNLSDALPLLLLAPDAEVELKLTFAPKEPAPLTAYLYLRNNLTIMEGVQLSGRGAYPSFELGGRRPGTNAPLLFEVSECAEGGGAVRRTLLAHNTGRVRVRLRDWRVAGAPCAGRGFRLSPCAALALLPNESRPLTLAFTPDWTLARVAATLSLRSELGRATFPLQAAAPARLLPRCSAAAPRPAWEPALRAAGTLLALAALALVLAAAALDAERELRRARAARPPPAPRQPLDLRALAHAPQAPPPPVPRRPPPRRRRPPRPAADPLAERRAFDRWRQDVLTRHDDDDRSSEDNDVTAPAPQHGDDVTPLLHNDADEPSDEPPAPNDGYDADPETEDRPQGSGDDDAVSTGSGSASSSPTADVEDEADRSPPRERAPPSPRAGHSPAPDTRSASSAPPADVCVRPRQRRDTSETPRRGDRTKTFDNGDLTSRSRPSTAKHHTRKDKVSKRRERPPASPPRSPPRTDARAPGALRWGASWSSVVAARGGSAPSAAPGAPLAPIGSDVRRRPEPAPDHSLFYFNGDPSHAPPRDDFTWRPPPQVERPTFSPARDFLDEPAGVGNGSFRSINSVWGSTLEPRPAAAWLWGGYGADNAVRPPPGFGAPPRAVRPYDPFRSLASIWAPGALDWRADTPPPPAPAPPGPDDSNNN